MIKEIRKAIAIARKFNREVVKPEALAMDKKIQADPGYIHNGMDEKGE